VTIVVFLSSIALIMHTVFNWHASVCLNEHQVPILVSRAVRDKEIVVDVAAFPLNVATATD
jgi:hypothetical protein